MQQEKFSELVMLTRKAFEEICMELVSCEFSPCERFILEYPYKTAVIIGMTGSVNGRIHLECDLETAAKIALTMNFGERFDNPNDVYAYMAEFANMIGGRATTYMSEKFLGGEIRLTPPAIFSGKSLGILTPNIPSQIVYYSGNLGRFFIDIGYK
ncbi:MAG TPA: chemotaxis protein CheX [Candidatus Gastranaerophilales bacterium]|nr:chemotaxis protein CheX [Candidatus Gastranaerophilales bacterium]